MGDDVERVSNRPSNDAARNGGSARAEAISMSTLERAVGGGVITREQLDSIVALSPPASFGVPQPAAGVAEGELATEARRGLNAVTVAYWAGAIAVLFAFGWFLVDRWKVLGAGAVLLIAAVYAVVFLLAARVLAQHAFARASALALLLFVAMVPIVTWAVLSLTGYWDLLPALRLNAFMRGVTYPWDTVRWLPIDLMTLLAALAAARRSADSILGLPIAASTWFAFAHAMPAVIDPELLVGLASYLILFGAVAYLAIGYALESSAREGDDFAFWFYAVGLVALFAAVSGIWRDAPGVVAHATLLTALMLAVAGLYLRRVLFVGFASIGLIVYLGYLAFDVFRKTVGFPVVLATFGTVIILVAVWAQRRYPALLRRTQAAGRRRVPAGWEVLAGGLIIAAALTAAHVPSARAEIAAREHRFQVERWRVRNAKKMASVRKTRAPIPGRPVGPEPQQR